MAELPDDLVRKDLDVTRRALDKLNIIAPEKSFAKRIAEDFLNMARSYYADATHFAAKGDMVNAFAAVNYAHGWLDAGARLGVFDVGGDDRLFTLLE
ncbi:MAG TPA: DUF357 domain-containing protein [Thermoplasmata archaeon]|jgi:hypothetical protein|nr:DUF357 domain-containing protein [Thermoplasmata archaeon]